VTLVANIDSDVTTVAGISGDVSAVAAQVIGYDFSTTTAMADPGSGNVRFNNGTLSSVSQIALDDLDKNGVDQSAFIALFDDSTNTVKGTLVFRTSGGDVATFSITGLTDNTGWNQIAVTHVASSGTFSNGEDVYIGFSRAGDAGDASAALTTRGDLLKRGASAVERLAIGGANTVLLTDGTDPSWGQVSLTAGVTGTLPLAQGGIGATSLASAGIAALAADQTFTAANRGTITTDNDLSFDLNVTNNWKATPSGGAALTFTNHTAGQSGNILLINSGGHAISLHANTKGDANLATTISTAGTYWLSYYDDGTNAYVVSSAVFA
jgi:hypothetical protein